ncbi:MAG: hypothetical protein KC910_28040, partial [Candidatus Eremiobacteraeota bacterium]|nr:hypothetical protein [Candidatus Eremiobacteraeota bacterium]
YNRGYDLERMQDCLTAAAYLHQQYPQPLRILAVGEAAAWAVLMRPFIEPANELDLKDAKLDLELPLLQRLGGYPEARRLGQKEPSSP